ncbi:MAG: GNAT family N-acetyltransferase [Betaproteobacteria bacterium]|nr:GNAT family N-acetyltransferase [Betaproteobacteria bacterium]
MPYRPNNFLGRVYPTADLAALGHALGIQPGERVLDAGGGGAPLPEATVVVEYDLASGHDRDGAGAPLDARWVAGDVQALPFADGAFDFAYCSHVLEHVADPAQACEELMRVARRGYIETPRKLSELTAGHPTHRWLVEVVDGVLTFERRWFVEHPLQNLALAHILNHPDAMDRALVEYRNLTCVQLAWTGRFEYRVVETPNWRNLFDYDNPVHAAWSHYFYALNLLGNGAPADYVAGHPVRAADLLPGEPRFHLLDGAVKLLQGRTAEAGRALARAAELGSDDEALARNLELLHAATGPAKGCFLPDGRGWIERRHDTGPAMPARGTALPHRRLAYPLNVYAHLLYLKEGEADDPHYGLFAPTQQRSSQLLLSRLPAVPCRLLAVGVGLGVTLAQLAERGHAMTGISADPEQIALARMRLGARADLLCVRLEDMPAELGPFDRVLFQESAQYIDLLALFEQTARLLRDDGELLILDEIAWRRVAPGAEGLHLAQDLLAMAKRFGFELVEQEDLSQQAAPTVDYRIAGLAAERARLVADLGVSPAQIDELIAANRRHRERYADGRFGYCLLRFRKARQPRWRLAARAEADTPALLALFQRAFGHAMAPEQWAWKYGDGHGHGTVVWQDGQPVAHYGGMGRRILYRGRPEWAVQIGDVMVEPAERGVLTKGGPFFLAAAAFLERHIGFGRRYLLGFGFPNARAMRVAERLGLYAEVGSLVELAWPALARGDMWHRRTRPLDPNAPRDRHAVDRLWHQMAAGLGDAIVGVRDWQWIERRYLTQPQGAYRLFLHTDWPSGKPRGLLVLRRHDDRVELLDVVAPLAELPDLVQAARRIAGRWGLPRLECWITREHADSLGTAERTLRDLDIRVPANAWTAAPPMAEVAGRWWLMSGDTDFR